MKRKILISAIIVSAIVATAIAQPRGAIDFQLLKINTNFISSPQFTYTGAEQFQADQRERWLEVEVTFACAPEFTDELTLKYFILVNGKLLTGEVTHVNIPAGRENRSVMYVTDRKSTRLNSSHSSISYAVFCLKKKKKQKKNTTQADQTKTIHTSH